MAEHVCPVWIGYLLASPLRKLIQNPRVLLSPWLKPGMKALDVGSAMGFFSLPMAEMARPGGMVYCVDLQPKMLQSLQKRARRKNLDQWITAIACEADDLKLQSLENQIDIATAIAVVHETKDARHFFAQIYAALKSGGILFFSEPGGHVSAADFQKSLEITRELGLKIIDQPQMKRNHTVILQK